MAEVLRKAAGWYGKLPSRGDFVGRGLPPAFQRAWDEAWQQALAEIAQRHGPAEAKERLRSMGVQRFMARMPGEPLLWAGVVMPSEDRVGRGFPLMVAEAWEPDVGDAALRPRVERLESDLLPLVAGAATPKDLDALLQTGRELPLAARGRADRAGEVPGTSTSEPAAVPDLRTCLWLGGDVPDEDMRWWPARDSAVKALSLVRA